VAEEEVRNLFSETRRAAERSSRPDAIAGAVGVFGIVRGMAGSVREALVHLEEATGLARDAGRVALEVALLAALGYLRAATGDLRGALEIADRGIAASGGDVDLGAELAFLRPVVFLTALRGFVLTYLGRLDEAGRALADALAIADRDQEAEVAGWINGWKVLHAQASGAGGSALEQARCGLEVAERTGSPFSQVVALAYLGRAYALRRQWPEAVAALSRSLERARLRRTGLETEAGTLADLAEARLETGELEEALRLANEAVTLAQRRGLALDECAANRVLARTLLESARGSRRRVARRHLERALELARDAGARALEPAIQQGLAELARLEGNVPARFAALANALELYREIGAAEHAERLAVELASDPDAAGALEGAGTDPAAQGARKIKKY
jgi:tetratricopeptide (TPR) repeat protein